MSKLKHCYTLECNFHGGISTNLLAPHDEIKTKIILEEEKSE